LRTRAGGEREAGAFLLARSESRRVVDRYVYFDDLEAACLKGHIHLTKTAFVALWELCRANRLLVIADVHTHFNRDVAQSAVDRANPLIARPGHVAIVVPNLGEAASPTHIGVHVYRGSHAWSDHYGRRASRRVRVTG